jgi:predicted ribosomally synthesized peptide with nif11-like leader
MNTANLADELTKLVDAVVSDESFGKQLSAAKSPEEKAKIAQGRGFNISADEFRGIEEVEATSQEGELKESELGQVTGGGLNLGHFAASLQSYLKKMKNQPTNVEGTTSTDSPNAGQGGEGGEKYKKSNIDPVTVTFP